MEPVTGIRTAVDVRHVGGILLESWGYGPGPAGETAAHVHAEYQIGLCMDMPGEYRTPAGRFSVPVGGIAVIHPDVRHSARDPVERRKSAHFLMVYFRPEDVDDARGWEGHSPLFADPVIHDADLAMRITSLFSALEQCASPLTVESAIVDVMTVLTVRHGRVPPARMAAPARKEVARARDMLHAELKRAVSLAELAHEAGLSRYHLLREFQRTLGLTPHVYHRSLRVDRARQLLAAGWEISRVALATGFADQSHLNRRFRELVGVTPGQYRCCFRPESGVQHPGAGRFIRERRSESDGTRGIPQEAGFSPHF